jgi:hypothetical protein
MLPFSLFSSVSVREAGDEEEVCQTDDHHEGTRFLKM